MNWLKEMLSEYGSVSCMRIVFLLVVGTYLFNWTYFNFTTGQFINFDLKDILALAAFAAAKVGQKKLENNK